ncbi:MAG: DUF454 domain-containing protein [Clostridiales bacterium]|nr:DUF454 domain-containing protein [Clostridiales bacterium]
MKKSFLNVVFIILAFFFLSLGIIGVMIPILPTTPFLLAAAFFFAKGSPKFNQWFLSTTLYKNHLEEFITSRSMTLKKKLWIVIPVSTMLLATALLIERAAVWVLILTLILTIFYYFTYQIKTIKD